MSERKSRKPILYNGQVYSEHVVKKSSGFDKPMKKTFEESREIILNDISVIRTSINSMNKDLRLPNELIISFTLGSEFTAKSYYPDSLFDRDVERFGFKDVGSRLVWKEKEGKVNEDGKPLKSSAKMFFVRATEYSLSLFEDQLKKDKAVLTRKFQRDVQKIDSLGFLSPEERVLGISDDWTSGRLEAVLHPFDIDDQKVLESFLDKIKQSGVDMNNVKYKQYSTGVTFVSFIGNKNTLEVCVR